MKAKTAEETRTVKMWVKTLKNLRLLAVLREQTMLETLDQLIQTDLLRAQEGEKRRQHRTNAIKDSSV